MIANAGHRHLNKADLGREKWHTARRPGLMGELRKQFSGPVVGRRWRDNYIMELGSLMVNGE